MLINIRIEKNAKTTKLFTTVNRECVGPTFNSYKRQDNIQISDDLIQKGCFKSLSQITDNNLLIILNRALK